MLSLFLFVLAVGCQQKMAEQPAPRVYGQSKLFENGQASRPLEAGVVARGQRPDSYALVSGLSEKGRTIKPADFSGDKAYSKDSVVPPAGAPSDVDQFVTEFPFEMKSTDMVRGQQRYNIYCALCHGAAGDANGKIQERGFLRPPSYHQDPDNKAMDYSTIGQPSTQLHQGYSRGFFRYGKEVPLREVPVGYIFQVITWGYGGMPDHASQIPPDDRWRITAYVRALQLSQGADAAKLPEAEKKKLNNGNKEKDQKH